MKASFSSVVLVTGSFRFENHTCSLRGGCDGEWRGGRPGEGRSVRRETGGGGECEEGDRGRGRV